jgi:hypothetical protein
MDVFGQRLLIEQNQYRDVLGRVVSRIIQPFVAASLSGSVGTGQHRRGNQNHRKA